MDRMDSVEIAREYSASVVSASLIQDDGAVRADYEKQGAWGLLASIDLHHCDHSTITDPEKIRQFVYELCDRIGMKRHGECRIERFGDGDLEGYSVAQFIETSLVSAHFDEKVADAAYLDIFSCHYFNPYPAATFAREFFGASDHTLTYVLRK